MRANKAKTKGHCDIEDAYIARWCAQKKRVLITVDSDFRTKWVKSKLLAKHGVETIVLMKDPEGLPEQHRQVTLFLPRWDAALAKYSYGFRVWEQRSTGEPTIQEQVRGPRRQ